MNEMPFARRRVPPLVSSGKQCVLAETRLGRNRQLYAIRLQFQQDVQHSTLVLNFSKIISMGGSCGLTECYLKLKKNGKNINFRVKNHDL
jgi:hypothetical protein